MIIMPGAAAAPVPSCNPAGPMETLASPVAALSVGENKALWGGIQRMREEIEGA